MFAGQADGNPLIQVVMEKQLIVVKHFISEKIQLPSYDEMIESLEGDKHTCSKVGLRKFFKGTVAIQWKYVLQLKALLDANLIENTCLNEKFNASLNLLIEKFRSFVSKGDYIEFKTYDYSQLIANDFEYDTTGYF
mmetsp:Transcript_33420/g.38385  ORF Transcript_33420/g.38385 Transcript_33420/m.38385 type:complete len:136 (+) Transcript_33420:1021-1428(+)